VFEITATGTEKVLFNFHGYDGFAPVAGLVLAKGTLYGTTMYGGDSFCAGPGGCGTWNGFDVDD
jgi:hypothetical protein